MNLLRRFLIIIFVIGVAVIFYTVGALQEDLISYTRAYLQDAVGIILIVASMVADVKMRE